ncbi:MAG: PEP-utilizing enzyme [Chloroflexi bacterium]|nr:PEP-utilizing enzyme [Chloroflexota bacterium]
MQAGSPESAAFPIIWEDSAHAGMFWQWDEFRFPTPLTPFTWSVWEKIRSGGAVAGGPRRQILMNGYQYSAKWPPAPGPDQIDDAEEMRKSRELIAAQPALWRDELLPELERDIQGWRNLDLPAISDEELRQTAETSVERHVRHWRIHMMAVGPVYQANALLDGLLDRILGEGTYDTTMSYRLLQGEVNQSWVTARALAAVAERARPHTEVVRALAADGGDPARLRERVAGLPGGPEFLTALDEFLDQFGYRAAAGEDFSDVLWRADPSFVLAAVRGYVSRPPLDETARRQRLRDERDAIEADLLARCADDPALTQEFRETLALARAAWPVRESHSFYIEQQSIALVRTIHREVGRRLAARGLLDEGDDVFFLSSREVLAAWDGAFEGDSAELARSRKADYAEQRRMSPPTTLGTPPPADRPRTPGWLGLRERQTLNFQGAAVIPPSDSPWALRGIAASRGVVSGPARIVRGPQEFGKVRPGDVLVCPSTTPPWSVLFGSVAALVAESGGSLSHGAIMAREFQIPAVMSVVGATHTLRDGQMVTVDGQTGEVRWGGGHG